MDKKRIVIYCLLFISILLLATYGGTRIGLDGLLVSFLFTLLYFTGIFIIATIVKDNSIVDMGWGLGFVCGSWITLMTTAKPTLLSYIIVGFISVWGIRLSVRLIKRNWGKPEDFRYANWRKEWGDKVVIIAFFRVFMAQGLINFLVGSVAYSIIKYNTFYTGMNHSFIVYVGLVIAFVGLFFEVVGDEQLRRHIARGSGTLLQTGLWSITRHPNYFGEILIWIGLYLCSLTLVLTNSVHLIYFIALAISPLLMTVVLTKVSIPLLEDHMAEYNEWETYKQRVPMLIPIKWRK
ncbi:DUF1295 domain-containing protein [Atopobacter phocae]|uniref:DUF1295 domain-containing protein n=1 Tax=Atopobacter phocae TaxID=136492 RepID=UPI00046FFC24|nr:DUF1295 domain-containing protein [Atopobacter phocae]